MDKHTEVFFMNISFSISPPYLAVQLTSFEFKWIYLQLETDHLLFLPLPCLSSNLPPSINPPPLSVHHFLCSVVLQRVAGEATAGVWTSMASDCPDMMAETRDPHIATTWKISKMWQDNVGERGREGKCSFEDSGKINTHF